MGIIPSLDYETSFVGSERDCYRALLGLLDEVRRVAAAPPTAAPAATLVRTNDPVAMQADFLRLIRARDNKPVRLRE